MEEEKVEKKKRWLRKKDVEKKMRKKRRRGEGSEEDISIRRSSVKVVPTWTQTVLEKWDKLYLDH